MIFKDKIRFNDIKAILIFGVLYFPAFVFRVFNKNVWLCSERKNEARDNGYWMYKFIRENHPKQKCYYVICKKSKDRERIKKYKTVISWGSLKHYFIFIATRIRLSAHVDSDSPNARVTNFMDRHNLLRNKRVFLQHGITKDKISFGYFNVSKADLFVCAGKQEFEFCKKEFGYPQGNVVLTGFARYDGLKNNKQNTIAVIPTWRSWLNNVDKNIFIKSEYYIKYLKLINNNRLNQFLSNNGYTLVFYLHSEMQKYRELFNSNSSNVIIASQDKYDLQQLLCDSNILVTDYSSVAFDFGYMRKPVVYFQFDYKEYRRHQHPEGYFSYENDGFGPVFDNLKTLIFYLEKIISRGNVIEQKYLDRVETFFAFNDKNNCNRIYNEIIKL